MDYLHSSSSFYGHRMDSLFVVERVRHMDPMTSRSPTGCLSLAPSRGQGSYLISVSFLQLAFRAFLMINYLVCDAAFTTKTTRYGSRWTAISPLTVDAIYVKLLQIVCELITCLAALLLCCLALSVRLYQIESNHIKSHQIKSFYIKSNQVKPNQIEANRFTSKQITIGIHLIDTSFQIIILIIYNLWYNQNIFCQVIMSLYISQHTQ